MFLTTEPSVAGRKYTVIRVISGVGSTDDFRNLDARIWNRMVDAALAELQSKATQLGADGVIGVQISSSSLPASISVVLIGTAIKFQNP